jgi:hypothetical protein
MGRGAEGEPGNIKYSRSSNTGEVSGVGFLTDSGLASSKELSTLNKSRTLDFNELGYKKTGPPKNKFLFDLTSFVKALCSKDTTDAMEKSKIPRIFYDKDDNIKAVIEFDTAADKTLNIFGVDENGKGYAVKKALSLEDEGSRNKIMIDDGEMISPLNAAKFVKKCHKRASGKKTRSTMSSRDLLADFWNDQLLYGVIDSWERKNGTDWRDKLDPEWPRDYYKSWVDSEWYCALQIKKRENRTRIVN